MPRIVFVCFGPVTFSQSCEQLKRQDNITLHVHGLSPMAGDTVQRLRSVSCQTRISLLLWTLNAFMMGFKPLNASVSAYMTQPNGFQCNSFNQLLIYWTMSPTFVRSSSLKIFAADHCRSFS